jgi:ankyrin repeat protein
MNSALLAYFRETAAVLAATTMTSNAYILREVFSWVREEQVVNAINRVCKFWRRNVVFANPNMRFHMTTNRMLIHALWMQSSRFIINSEQTLIRACKFGISFAVVELLDDAAVPIRNNDRSVSPLVHAVAGGDKKTVWWLLKSSRIRPEAADNAALQTACTSNNLDLMKVLLDRPIVASTFSSSCVEMMCRRSWYPGVKLLLRKCRRKDEIANEVCLRAAIEANSFPIVNLLAQYASSTIADVRLESIALAATLGRGAIVERLLQTPNVLSHNLFSAALAAAKRGYIDILQMFISPSRFSQTEIDTFVTRDNNILIFVAVCSGSQHVVRTLLELYRVRRRVVRDVKKKRKIGYVNQTAFEKRATLYDMAPANRCHPEIFNFIHFRKENNNDVLDITDLLSVAAVCNRLSVVELLLEPEYADTIAADTSALRLAVQFKHWEVVERLVVDGRIDVAIDNDFVLIETARCAQGHIVQKLLATQRVNPAVQFNAPLLGAIECHDEWIVEQLLACRSVTPQALKNKALTVAINQSNMSMAIRVARDPRIVDTSFDDHWVMRRTVELNWGALLEVLLTKKNVTVDFDDNYCIREAFVSQKNHILRVLLSNRKYIDKIIFPAVEIINTFVIHPDVPPDLVRLTLTDRRLVLNNAQFRRQIVDVTICGNLDVLNVLLADKRAARITLDSHGRDIFRRVLQHRSITPARLTPLIEDARFFAPEIVHQTLLVPGLEICWPRMQSVLLHPRVLAGVNLHNLALRMQESHRLIGCLLQLTNYDPSCDNNALLIRVCQTCNERTLRLLLLDARVDPRARFDLPLAILSDPSKWHTRHMVLDAIHRRALASRDLVRIAEAEELLKLTKQRLPSVGVDSSSSEENTASPEDSDDSDDERPSSPPLTMRRQVSPEDSDDSDDERPSSPPLTMRRQVSPEDSDDSDDERPSSPPLTMRRQVSLGDRKLKHSNKRRRL